MKIAGCGDGIWVKSSFCESNGCIEVMVVDQDVAVRDSAIPDGPVLKVSLTDWAVFIAGAKAGEFDMA